MLNEVVGLASFGLYPVRLHHPIFTEEGVKCSCGRPKCTAQGKHPVGVEWGKSATQDVEIIEQQFSNADWNVGIILGLCHGIPAEQAVIDIEDDSLEGRALADTLLREYPCPTYTSGKSLHRIYRWSDKLPPVANMTINGLEFRFGGKGKETQSVAPPSRHHSGKYYEWIEGRSLEDLPIPELPDHIIEYICEEYARQAHTAPDGVSSVDPRKFRSPRGKIGPGARHHSLLKESHNLWRYAYKIWGINGFEEQEVIDQVWMWLLGANAIVCDPPKTEAEVHVIFKSSQSFMYKEILKEIEEKEAQAAAAENPVEDDSDETFGGWLYRHGMQLVRDKRISAMDDSPERTDEWRCNWKLEYLTQGDEELIGIKIPGFDKPCLLTPVEFESSSTTARKIQQETNGAFCLSKTFPSWTWAEIWKGRRNDKKGKNGITRGLKEFLQTNAQVVENKQQDLADQVEDLILGMAGNLESVKTGLAVWMDSALKDVPDCRLKTDGRGSLCVLRAPEDPLTGWYYHEKEILLLVKMDELNKRYRSSYGSGVANRLISEAMTGDKLGFEKKKFRDGPLAGRWFSRSGEKLKE